MGMRGQTKLPLYSVGEEIAHATTHGLGLLLSIAGLTTLVAAASVRGDARHLVGGAVFGATLVLLFAASTLYHAITSRRVKRVFQRLDHAAIFLLIAGTYTPFTLVNLRGAWGWTLLGLVWSLAILGIVLQTAFPQRTRRLSVPLYLTMGWMVLIAIEPLAQSVHPDGLTLLVLGGVIYSLGVVFYAWQRLPYNHAVWHVFVLAGSGCHFSCVLGYVIPGAP
ncbi:MAG: PAQR family membrane homeostasis protein TrhA [Planctomycetota bacterium]|jgi:hemolysin III